MSFEKGILYTVEHKELGLMFEGKVMNRMFSLGVTLSGKDITPGRRPRECHLNIDCLKHGWEITGEVSLLSNRSD